MGKKRETERKMAEDRYSLNVAAPKFIDILENAAKVKAGLK